MIKLSFIMGGNIRKIIIEKRKITFITPELKFVPLIIELDNIKDKISDMEKMNFSDDEKKMIEELSILGSEEEIYKDIKNDFQNRGWRCIYKNVS